MSSHVSIGGQSYFLEVFTQGWMVAVPSPPLEPQPSKMDQRRHPVVTDASNKKSKDQAEGSPKEDRLKVPWEMSLFQNNGALKAYLLLFFL